MRRQGPARLLHLLGVARHPAPHDARRGARRPCAERRHQAPDEAASERHGQTDGLIVSHGVGSPQNSQPSHLVTAANSLQSNSREIKLHTQLEAHLLTLHVADMAYFHLAATLAGHSGEVRRAEGERERV